MDTMGTCGHSVPDMAKHTQDRIRLWQKNVEGLQAMADKSNGLVTVGKLANFAIAMYLTAKKKKLEIKR